MAQSGLQRIRIDDKETSLITISFGRDPLFLKDVMRYLITNHPLGEDKVRFFFSPGYYSQILFKDNSTTEALKILGIEQADKNNTVYEVLNPIMRKWKSFLVLVTDTPLHGIIFWGNHSIYVVAFWGLCGDGENPSYHVKFSIGEKKLIRRITLYVSKNSRALTKLE